MAQGYGQEPFFGLSVKYHLPPDINLMQQPDEIIQDAVPATSGHVLKIALVASVLLHLVVLAVWKMPPSPESTVAKRTLHISLTSQPSLNQPTGEISQAIEQHPPVPPSLPSKEEPELVSVDEAGSEAQNEEQPAQPIATAAWAMVRAYIAQEAANTQDTKSQSCDLAQRASKVRRCAEDDSKRWRDFDSKPYDETFEVAFAPLTRGDQLHRDKAVVARLVRKQELLDEIVKLEGFEPDDIAQMRREIREEIDYIESRYARANLFTVIRVGAEVATNLWKAVRDRRNRN